MPDDQISTANKRLAERLPKPMADDAIINHLSDGKVYIEIDEPEGFITHEIDPQGNWRVARKSVGQQYDTIGRFDTLREALSAAIGLR